VVGGGGSCLEIRGRPWSWSWSVSEHVIFLGGQTSFSGSRSGIQSYNERVYHLNDDCIVESCL
jgi:hypothetical protein